MRARRTDHVHTRRQEPTVCLLQRPAQRLLHALRDVAQRLRCAGIHPQLTKAHHIERALLQLHDAPIFHVQ
jgi:hypothetical protein